MKIKHLLFVALAFLTLNLKAQYYSNAAAVFNGASSYIAVPPSMETDLLTTSHQYTLEAWIYPTAYTNFPTIIGKNYGSSFWLGLNTGGNIRFYPGTGGYFESPSVVPLNEWSHVAVTFDETNATIFLNGDSIITNSAYAGTIGSNSDSLFIGCDRNGSTPSYFFTGKMDMVRLWNRVRTGNQIRQYMHVPLELKGNLDAANFNGLIASYNLDGHAYDWSGIIYDYGVENNMDWDATGYQISPYADFNNALILDGHSYASVALMPEFNASTAITIEAWVCRNRQMPYSNMQDIITKSGMTLSYNYGFYYNTDSSKLSFATLNLSGGSINVSKKNVLNDDIWHHIAATYNSVTGNAALYIDGDSVAGNYYPTHPLIVDDGDSLYIGKEKIIGSENFKFKGMIDEIRIWKDSALTTKQIRENMFSTTTAFITPPTYHAGISFGEHTNFVHTSTAAYAGVIDFKGNCRISSGHLSDSNLSSPLLFTPFDNVGTNYLGRRSFLDITGADAVDSLYCSDYGVLTSVNVFALLGTQQPFLHQLSVTDPLGNTVNLTGPASGSMGGKDIMTVFKGNAISSLTDNFGPYSPSVMPYEALTNLNYTNINGWWKITSRQFSPPTVPTTLYGWGIHLEFSPFGVNELNKDGYLLSQNSPNPAEGHTIITFTIPNKEAVELSLKNNIGQCIQVLAYKVFEAGTHHIELDNLNLPAGLYYYTMKAGSFSATKKMLITK